jgi:hypothetical protein
MENNNKPETKGKEEIVTKIQFPVKHYKKVIIKRKAIPTNIKGETILGQIPEDFKVKIGSSYKGTSVLRGLTLEEEKRFLPSIIGISPESQNWENATKDYWNNISKDVPLTGLELEIGIIYNNIEDLNFDNNLYENTIFKAKVGIKGTPINIADYILWRYCKVYSRVANDIEDINKSAKIEFYIYSKDKETQTKKALLDLEKEANKLYYSSLGDRDWINHTLRVLTSLDKTNKYTVSNIELLTDDEKDIALNEYLKSNPALFLAIGKDKNLEIKAFVETCVAKNILQRIPNTSTITFDNETIGNTLEEVVAFLTNGKNTSVVNTLKARLTKMP